ncbi:MAG: photosynthetic reaction center cytochrome c subunit family protein, partial [Vicinamibacterales bacterium]
LKSKRILLGVVGTAAAWLLAVASVAGQAAPAPKPVMAEDVFKSVQVLKGITVNEFMQTMGFFSASLGLNCTSCHGEESGSDWASYADDRPLRKQTTRRMVLMVNALNRANFQGRQIVTCYSCHRGDIRPQIIPSLDVQYAEPVYIEPDELPEQAPRAPAADQVLDKYLQAIGGLQRLAGISSISAKGIRQDYDDVIEKYPVEVVARATGQHATTVRSRNGDRSVVFDGIGGWIAAPLSEVPVPVLPMTAEELDAAKVDAALFFPAKLKQSLTQWRVGFPTTIDNRDVLFVQGISPAGSAVKLYFDRESGLLIRQVRYSKTMVGRVPTKVEYADYRDVAGVKLPFRMVTTWTDGRSITELSDVQVNVAIETTKFGRPAVPVPVP